MARIYNVFEKNMAGGAVSGGVLVRANTQAQAIGHVVRNRYGAEVADQETLVRLLADGVKVEECGDSE